jgi:hypothetical protein
MLRAIFLVSALASPLATLDQGGQVQHPDQQSAQTSSSDDKDLCSYLKDVESKMDEDCGPNSLAILKSQDPATYFQKSELARQRKTVVLKAYEYLKAPPALEPAGRDAGHSNGPNDQYDQRTPPGTNVPNKVLPTQLEPPINERTFPAWLGPEAMDLKEVQTRWLGMRNQDLQREMENPLSPEQRKQIEAALAAPDVRIVAVTRRAKPHAAVAEKLRGFEIVDMSESIEAEA